MLTAETIFLSQVDSTIILSSNANVKGIVRDSSNAKATEYSHTAAEHMQS